ncbi:replication factor A protein 3 [Neohortaea acidophila]|uniref:Replication factor A protein 3 n=1 Tax=Neohortaea acidophila TaxID=245834 RepID=A0A6A6Q3P0_9PEZI|nr:replication factor A protein 3 [Neohortaea acidophila]KAF2486273.1 replication factor A protein 3 [Neohortaea acidophila]
MSEITPRVTQPYLGHFTGKVVRILGKVSELQGDTASIDAGGNIALHLNREAHLTLNHAVEVIGKVQGDDSVRVMAATDFGPQGDFNAVEAVVDATHRYHEIFYNKD